MPSQIHNLLCKITHNKTIILVIIHYITRSSHHTVYCSFNKERYGNNKGFSSQNNSTIQSTLSISLWWNTMFWEANLQTWDMTVKGKGTQEDFEKRCWQECNKYIVATMSLHFYIYYFLGDIYYAWEENKNSRSKNDNADGFWVVSL